MRKNTEIFNILTSVGIDDKNQKKQEKVMSYKFSEISGRSMIEMLGVLAIIGVLSVGGIAAFSQMMSRYKVAQTQTQINAIAATLSAVGSEASSYAGLNNKAAIKFGAIPKEAIADAEKGKLITPFNGYINITPASNNMAYLIMYVGISKDACLFLATQDWGTKNSYFEEIGLLGQKNIPSQWIAALTSDAENNTVDNSSVIKSAKYTPVSPVDAAKGCNCKQESCTIALKFN